MSKRNAKAYERRERDFYPTPPEATDILVPYLRHVEHFVEPMCGNGAIVKRLQRHGKTCVDAYDINPVYDDPEVSQYLREGDITRLMESHEPHCRAPVVTNPPWPSKSGKAGEPTIGFIKAMLNVSTDAYVLLPSDFLFTVAMAELIGSLKAVYAVGRLSWQGNGKPGFDNCAWYHFGPETETINCMSEPDGDINLPSIHFAVNPGRPKKVKTETLKPESVI